MKIRDLVDVRSQPTVVRLDHLDEADNTWIHDSYYITAEVGNHFKTLDYLLSREQGQGTFLIGHYGSGKSHFLAYLTQTVATGKLGKAGIQTLPISLLNFSADKTLEQIITHALNLPDRTDRRGQWQAVAERFPNGLLLILDELSEFLRSKADMRTFNEDIRYLQFMGEWSTDHKLWIVAALQEKIEHTGEMEHDLFRKIKDRYPMRLILSPTHVKDLIGERILVKAKGYQEAVATLAGQLKRAFPDNPMDYERFTSIYPLHPTTLDLLEEVRDRFSQARGIVGFTITRLAGDPARGLPSFLDEPWGSLLSPDTIVDHFRDLFEVQPEFLPLAQKVLPYYRKHMARLFPKQAQQDLAERLLKLLLLVHLSPERKDLGIREAAWWLLYKVSTIDPSKNESVIRRILDTMSGQGAFIKKQGDRYGLDLADDGQETLDHLIQRTAAELENKGQTLLESLIPLLKKSDFNPFTLDRERWQKHGLMWYFHERTLHIYLGGGSPTCDKGIGLQLGLPWGEPAMGRNCFRLQPKTLDVSGELVELAALMQLRERPLTRQILKKIGERIRTRLPIFAAGVRTAYLQGILTDSQNNELPLHGISPDGGVKAWIGRLGEILFRRTWPRFETFAPSHGALPREAYRQLMEFATNHDLLHADAPDLVRTVREAYLVPMKLMERKGRFYHTPTRLDKHELLTAVKDMLAHKTSPKRYYEHLATPVYGLVPDQVHLLLMFLMIQGEIDIIKGRNSYRDLYETFPTPDQYDLVVPGKALSVTQLNDLTQLCKGLEIAPPKEANVLAQRRCAGQLQRLGRKRRDECSAFLARVGEQGDLGDLHQKIERHMNQWAALEKGDNELQAVQHFLFEIGSPGRFLETHGELLRLPRKLEGLLTEMRRLVHLLKHPGMANCASETLRLGAEHLGDPPDLSETDALEEWLAAAKSLHGQFKEWYSNRHDRFWSSMRRHPVWDYQIPKIAGGRQLGLSEVIDTFKRDREHLRTQLCEQLNNLDFQPACLCGFDGHTAAVEAAIADLARVKDEIEENLTRFFGQDSVKQKVREWLDTGVESFPGTHAYLSGEEKFPQINNLALFDQHLAGLDLFRRYPVSKITELLTERTWDRAKLLAELDGLFHRLGPRLAFEKPQEVDQQPRKALATWCLEQALRTGSPLPDGLGNREREDFVDELQPRWVGAQALAKLAGLGLGEEVENAVLRMVLDGRLDAGSAQEEGPVFAAQSLLKMPQIGDAADLTGVAAALYRQHGRMMKLERKNWLKRLDELAHAPLECPSLYDVLAEHQAVQWLVIDCLGAPLLPAFDAVLEDLLPHWKRVSCTYAMVGTPSDTKAFFDNLALKGFNKPLLKRNAVDTLIHEAGGDFLRLEKRALAELEILGNSLAELDQGRNLLIFADHGFRLAKDGKGFTHGGDSSLERLVPLYLMEAYR